MRERDLFVGMLVSLIGLVEDMDILRFFWQFTMLEIGVDVNGCDDVVGKDGTL